jgi:CheY-like chemotaxis protein
MMRAEQTAESELRARVERLRRERDWARVAAQEAKERIRALVRERDALARANQELSRREESQAQRLSRQEREAISAFAGSIAHDFNNVLAVITSGLELLARTDQPERRARLIRRIEEAAWRGSELTRQLQAFGRALGEAARVEDAAAGDRGGVSVLLPGAVGSPGAPDHLSVLVVEDDDQMAALASDMLVQLGHRGLRVSSVPAAVAVLSGSEAVDLIFADVLLSGGGSGFDLAREIERRKLRLPIVLTSGFGAGMRERLAAARLPFLPKPYTLARLQEVLRRAARPPGP